MEIQSFNSGKSFFAITDHAGQQEVAIKGSFLGTSSIKSFASSMVHKSAPIATSIASSNPSALSAARSFPGVTFAPNCPAAAGATAAYTGTSLLIACIVWKI